MFMKRLIIIILVVLACLALSFGLSDGSGSSVRSMNAPVAPDVLT